MLLPSSNGMQMIRSDGGQLSGKCFGLQRRRITVEPKTPVDVVIGSNYMNTRDKCGHISIFQVHNKY